MDINTPVGSKIIVTDRTKNSGNSGDRDKVDKYLEVGKEYELEAIFVSGYHTNIWLKGISEVMFNSVNFENVEGYESKGKHEMFKKIIEE